MELGELIVWVVIGLLAGSLAGMVVNQSRQGFGLVTNLIFGLVGAVVGGFLFDKLEIDVGLGSLTISGNQVAAAFVGALILVVLAKFLEGRRHPPKKQ
ncbi:MAG: GlsB/YeaQ/YmgE family stress response membrane protein [Planctomycetes bacterium]|nr:GlsB/YeaQ/YmgE family stress response membrane protein [Planctomycetota bacterium]